MTLDTTTIMRVHRELSAHAQEGFAAIQEVVVVFESGAKVPGEPLGIEPDGRKFTMLVAGAGGLSPCLLVDLARVRWLSIVFKDGRVDSFGE